VSLPGIVLSDKTVRQTHGENYEQQRQFWRTYMNQ
jgi:hypothetical protein